MNLGKKQILTVVKEVEFGVYLGNEEERVLLPKKQVPEGTEVGDELEVFLYRDSSDRLIATTNEPMLEVGQVAVLKVAAVGPVGAFLDWGLEKELLLPFKEQTTKVAVGDQCLAALYIDKSKRLCATMNVYEYLKLDAPYEKDDEVSGMIYETSDEFGVFVAVDNQYSALIPRKEAFGTLKIGNTVQARVVAVKPDGKLDLSVREKIPVQMDKDAKQLSDYMSQHDGQIPFTDKADAQLIHDTFGMSKNAFKRAVGRLLKNGEIEIKEKTIAIRGK